MINLGQSLSWIPKTKLDNSLRERVNGIAEKYDSIFHET